MSISISTYTPSDKIVSEIEQILNSDKIKENECISLCDIAGFIKEKNAEYNKVIMNYKNICETKLRTKLNSLKYIIYNIDFYDNELHILFSRIGGDKNAITFQTLINYGDGIKKFLIV